jgi:hypothetical protein
MAGEGLSYAPRRIHFGLGVCGVVEPLGQVYPTKYDEKSPSTTSVLSTRGKEGDRVHRMQASM